MIRRLFAVAALCAILAGCETASKVTTVKVCPIIPQWSAEWQSKLAAEVRKLPPGSNTAQALDQLIRLRDQARACLAKPVKP